MSKNESSRNRTLILAAIIGSVATIGAALITKGFFDKKIEKSYTPKEEILTEYTPNTEAKLLEKRIKELENQLIIEKKKQHEKEVNEVLESESKGVDIGLNEPDNIKRVGDWKFELLNCTKKGNSIHCNYAITSLYKNRVLRLHLGGNYAISTILYDDKGNEYKSDRGSIANTQVPGYLDRTFIADIRTEGTVTFTNIATNATKISALYLCFGGRQTPDTMFDHIEFKDVDLDNK